MKMNMKDHSYNTSMPDERTLDKMETLLSLAADSTRLKILYALAEGEKSVTEIVREAGASQSLVSHQLSLLRKNHLAANRKEGTKVYYRLADEHIISLLRAVREHVGEKR
jgi:ArsR family transcriptional regulator